jgi:hypothetical protein
MSRSCTSSASRPRFSSFINLMESPSPFPQVGGKQTASRSPAKRVPSRPACPACDMQESGGGSRNRTSACRMSRSHESCNTAHSVRGMLNGHAGDVSCQMPRAVCARRHWAGDLPVRRSPSTSDSAGHKGWDLRVQDSVARPMQGSGLSGRRWGARPEVFPLPSSNTARTFPRPPAQPHAGIDLRRSDRQFRRNARHVALQHPLTNRSTRRTACDTLPVACDVRRAIRVRLHALGSCDVRRAPSTCRFHIDMPCDVLPAGDLPMAHATCKRATCAIQPASHDRRHCINRR